MQASIHGSREKNNHFTVDAEDAMARGLLNGGQGFHVATQVFIHVARVHVALKWMELRLNWSDY